MGCGGQGGEAALELGALGQDPKEEVLQGE